MSKLNTLAELSAQEINELFGAELQLVKALPTMAAAASSSDLREAFEAHATNDMVTAIAEGIAHEVPSGA